jgi:hyperosmotically inducible protein
MKTIKMVLIGCILCSLLGFTMVGCEKEGPAEKAGKKVDKAMDSAKKAFKDTTHK